MGNDWERLGTMGVGDGPRYLRRTGSTPETTLMHGACNPIVRLARECLTNFLHLPSPKSTGAWPTGFPWCAALGRRVNTPFGHNRSRNVRFGWLRGPNAVGSRPAAHAEAKAWRVDG
jgi:hypothetical protein